MRKQQNARFKIHPRPCETIRLLKSQKDSLPASKALLKSGAFLLSALNHGDTAARSSTAILLLFGKRHLSGRRCETAQYLPSPQG